MPWSVMEALRSADGVTLHITWNGGEDIIIPSAAALNKDNGRIYYPLSYLGGGHGLSGGTGGPRADRASRRRGHR